MIKRLMEELPNVRCAPAYGDIANERFASLSALVVEVLSCSVDFPGCEHPASEIVEASAYLANSLSWLTFPCLMDCFHTRSGSGLYLSIRFWLQEKRSRLSFC